MADRPWVSYEEIKDKIGLLEVFDKLGVSPDTYVQKGDRMTAICPIHEHGPQPNKSGFKATKKGERWEWFCFGDCARGGSIVDLVMLVEKLDLAHARLWFAQEFGERLTAKRPKAGSETKPAKETFSDFWGVLLTLFTSGLFLIVWVIIKIFETRKPWSCQICGKERPW